MAFRDYLQWHDEYDRPGSRLHLRLLAVQDLVARALDELPDGRVRVISICAGQGHDLITVASRHRRGTDVEGVLVELDPRNVDLARAAIANAGLEGLEVIQADAALTSVYAPHVPADLLLVCGLFGNISEEDMAGTISWLPRLCRPGTWVVWTRYPRDGDIVTKVESHFAAAGFSRRALVVNDDVQLGVGAGRLDGPAKPYEPGGTLFRFIR